MNVKEIVAAYLKEHGFDGLVSDEECGCPIDDLIPCCLAIEDCEPAYLGKCEPPNLCEWCEDDGTHFSTERKEPHAADSATGSRPSSTG